MYKQIRLILMALVLCSSFVVNNTADACPMCAVANEDAQGDEELARPRAYMYSILFMLAMPATIFTAFGVSFYRLSRKRTAMNEEFIAANNLAEENPLNQPDSAEG